MRIYAGSWLRGALVSAHCCVAFSHMSLVWRFVCFVSCSVIFISRHTNSLDDAQVIICQPWWPAHCLMPLVVLRVFGVLGFCCVFCLFALVFCLFSVILSARDDAIGPCKVNL